MIRSPKLRRTAHPSLGWVSLRHALLLGVAAAATMLAVLVGNVLHPRPAQVEFLQAALGEPTKTQSFERRPAAGTVVRLAPGGYSVQSAGLTVGLRAADAGRGELQGFEHGAARRTEYGWEAVTVSENRTEQFLTVGKRQGVRRWRWQLQTLDLIPRVGGDGSVGFIDDGRLSDRLVLEPVRILDGERRDVTPKGLRWSVEEDEDGTWSLALDLDDRDLPLPYVIDPAIARRSVNSAGTGGATTLVITKPAGLVAGDLLVAQITAKGGTGTFICPPSASWTSIRREDSTTNLAQELFRISATATEVAATNFTFTFRSGATCFGTPSPTVSVKSSGGLAAYIDVANQADPVNVQSGSVNASSATTTVTGVTPTVANTRLVGFYGLNTGSSYTNAVPASMTEIWDVAATGGTAASRTTSRAADEAYAGTVATGNRNGTSAAAAINIGQLIALAPLAVDGSGTLTTPTTNVAASSAGNTLTFTYTAATGGMRNGSVTLVVPTGWSAPSTTATAAGYTTASTGTVGVAGQTITVSGVTLTAGSTFTVVYGSTAGSGPGATATATTGAQTWQAQQRSSSVSGALANLGASPSVTVNAADGSGTLTTPTTNVAASSTGNTLTFTYTAATGGMSNGAVRVTVPTGWSAPSTTGTAAGYTTASTGTVGVAGQVDHRHRRHPRRRGHAHAHLRLHRRRRAWRHRDRDHRRADLARRPALRHRQHDHEPRRLAERHRQRRRRLRHAHHTDDQRRQRLRRQHARLHLHRGDRRHVERRRRA